MLEVNDLKKLKLIHYNETGEILSDEESLEMGTRLLKLLKIIGKKIPENNQGLDK